MRTRQLIVWFAIGLLGLALAAGVTYAATQLSSQRIGLSAEPPSAGDELVPPPTRTPTRTTHTRPSDPTPTTTTAPPPVATTPDDTGESEYHPGQYDGDHDDDD